MLATEWANFLVPYEFGVIDDPAVTNMTVQDICEIDAADHLPDRPTREVGFGKTCTSKLRISQRAALLPRHLPSERPGDDRRIRSVPQR